MIATIIAIFLGAVIGVGTLVLLAVLLANLQDVDKD